MPRMSDRNHHGPGGREGEGGEKRFEGKTGEDERDANVVNVKDTFEYRKQQYCLI